MYSSKEHMRGECQGGNGLGLPRGGECLFRVLERSHKAGRNSGKNGNNSQIWRALLATSPHCWGVEKAMGNRKKKDKSEENKQSRGPWSFKKNDVEIKRHPEQFVSRGEGLEKSKYISSVKFWNRSQALDPWEGNFRIPRGRKGN